MQEELLINLISQYLVIRIPRIRYVCCFTDQLTSSPSSLSFASSFHFVKPNVWLIVYCSVEPKSSSIGVSPQRCSRSYSPQSCYTSDERQKTQRNEPRGHCKVDQVYHYGKRPFVLIFQLTEGLKCLLHDHKPYGALQPFTRALAPAYSL